MHIGLGRFIPNSGLDFAHHFAKERKKVNIFVTFWVIHLADKKTRSPFRAESPSLTEML
jgi:hypothetical protein